MATWTIIQARDKLVVLDDGVEWLRDKLSTVEGGPRLVADLDVANIKGHEITDNDRELLINVCNKIIRSSGPADEVHAELAELRLRLIRQ